jgi:DNA polymerase III epsilon subunit-like protein
MSHSTNFTSFVAAFAGALIGSVVGAFTVYFTLQKQESARASSASVKRMAENSDDSTAESTASVKTRAKNSDNTTESTASVKTGSKNAAIQKQPSAVCEKCGEQCLKKTSKTKKNPDRDFWTCNHGCDYFKWCDGIREAKLKTSVKEEVKMSASAKKTQSFIVLKSEAIVLKDQPFPPGVIVDLETTISRTSKDGNQIIEIGAIDTRSNKSFNIMVDFDAEQVALENNISALYHRLNEMGQNATRTIEFWDKYVFQPKFGWTSKNGFIEKLMQSRSKWNDIKSTYGGQVPINSETIYTIKKEYGDSFFFPQSYAILAIIEFTRESQATMWYAHNGDRFDFLILERCAQAHNIPLGIRRLLPVPENPIVQVPPSGKPVIFDGFDTLKFMRQNVPKGWITQNKNAGYSQESLYARFMTPLHTECDSPPDGVELPSYEAHNAADDCYALFQLLKAVESYLAHKDSKK